MATSEGGKDVIDLSSVSFEEEALLLEAEDEWPGKKPHRNWFLQKLVLP